jgi:hypothetical protein
MEIIIRRTAFKEGYTIGNLYILPEQADNENGSTPATYEEEAVPKQTVNEEKNVLKQNDNEEKAVSKQKIKEERAVPEWFCNTMEPTARKLTSQMPQTVIRRHKIIGKTAIPTGRYRILITRSRRFGRWLPLLLSVKGFEGIRIHAGNKPEDTRGCILLGFNRRKGYVLDSTQCVQQLMRRMTEAMEKGERVFVEVR